ncbi:hypothetical protein [Paenibacillus daejeonensis]|uniref:hypothetical protein n=1 Tax=Paenibacillus daejeonensis TaxID=135193 RepID=UPI000594660B|nr:hypothetical protein [Paenibacillus daejeonensis]
MLVRIALERLTFAERIYSQSEEMRRTIQLSNADPTPGSPVDTLLEQHEKLNLAMKEIINKEIFIEDIMELIVGNLSRPVRED